MANLVVSSVCNMACPYCFADYHMRAVKADSAPSFISLDDFEQRLDFLDRSGVNEIRLIGGEPTLHPQFARLIQRARQRGKPIVVFSHGVMPERALTCLEAIPPEACTVLVNMNATRTSRGPSQKEQARRRVVLQRLSVRALPGFNIYTTDFQLDHLLPLILETGCRKSIRLGLAQPIVRAQNVYLHPKQYPLVGQKVARLARVAARDGIRLEFDCGFVRCMFSDADIQTLGQANADLGWRCSAVLDIDLNGQAIHCFPLTGEAQIPVSETADATSLREALTARMRPYRVAGVYKECSTCRFKRDGGCTGGCLAATLRRFQHAPIRLVMPERVVQG